MKLALRLQLYALLLVAAFVIAVRIKLDVSWSDLAIPAVTTAMLALAFGWLIARSITEPIRELTAVTRDLAAGNLSTRPALLAVGEVRDLSTAVHRLAEQLGARMTALQAEDELLTALIESLNEGVVAVGNREQVLRINAAGRDLLRVTDAVPFPTARLPRLWQLQHAIDNALRGTTTDAAEVTLGDSTLSLTARPLEGGGAVLALFDLTRIRKLEMVRRDFVANVSHELRTPLTVIGGFAETLAEDDPAPESRRQFAATIRTHTERMQRIVDDLLDLSRLEAGRWMPEVSDIDMNVMVRETLASVEAAASDKPLALEIALEKDATRVVADRTAIRQILLNLLENAVRHTSSGSVTVFARREGAGVWVGVRDTGPGIGAEHLPRIFERFYRVDSGRARDSGGTGLGLAIVKHLVETHGGRLDAHSQVGKGTSIAAFFPDRPLDPNRNLVLEL
ncbi:MAG: HAMP domain-containing protein [Gemmatimonadaceae bacterium]|nr:HAMP domain-containing protein [Gemmatimonadaceae bacterium]MDQ3242654.1 ATP-binding protein [Gemmatimonadota bacterium]